MNCTNHTAVVEGVGPCSRCGRPFCGDCVVSIEGRRLCGRCKVQDLLDIRSGVNRLGSRLAGIGRRFAAVWVDGFILGIPFLIVFFVVAWPRISSGKMPGWMQWAGYALAPFYIVYEALMLRARGQTLGKMALGIRVVQPGGAAISSKQAWGRAVVRALFVSFLSILNYAPAFFTKEKTCIHDLAAKTRVVVDRG